MFTQYLFSLTYTDAQGVIQDFNTWATNKAHAKEQFRKDHAKDSLVSCDLMIDVIGQVD